MSYQTVAVVVVVIDLDLQLRSTGTSRTASGMTTMVVATGMAHVDVALLHLLLVTLTATYPAKILA